MLMNVETIRVSVNSSVRMYQERSFVPVDKDSPLTLTGGLVMVSVLVLVSCQENRSAISEDRRNCFYVLVLNNMSFSHERIYIIYQIYEFTHTHT